MTMVIKDNTDPHKRLREINVEAVDVASAINLLGSMPWPLHLEDAFLKALKDGSKFPDFAVGTSDFSEHISKLKRLLKSFKAATPEEVFTAKSIKSYINAARMADAVGTKAFEAISFEEFGKPGSTIPGTNVNSVEAAKRLIAIGANFDHPYISEPEICVSSEVVAEDIEALISHSFKNSSIQIEIVPELQAKATATAYKVRLRKGTCFSRYDTKQLFVHEVMTHALTAQNGLRQPVLKTLGKGAPRTTSTQEGLATYAEVVTNAIDLKRIMRLALRIVAIDNALNGADFRDVYRFFLENGQGPQESLKSTIRVFRAGTADRLVIFTKDSVYLDGLIRVSMLFQWAIKNERLDIVHLLFCGRLAVEDCFALEGSFKSGLIVHPEVIPPWYEEIESLAGSLLFNQFCLQTIDSNLDDYFAHIACG